MKTKKKTFFYKEDTELLEKSKKAQTASNLQYLHALFVKSALVAVVVGMSLFLQGCDLFDDKPNNKQVLAFLEKDAPLFADGITVKSVEWSPTEEQGMLTGTAQIEMKTKCSLYEPDTAALRKLLQAIAVAKPKGDIPPLPVCLKVKTEKGEKIECSFKLTTEKWGKRWRFWIREINMPAGSMIDEAMRQFAELAKSEAVKMDINLAPSTISDQCVIQGSPEQDEALQQYRQALEKL